MIFNKENLNNWIKIDLKDGKHLYIREKENIKKPNIKKVESNLDNKIKIRSRSDDKIFYGKTTFVLTSKENEFITFCEFCLTEDKALLTYRDQNEYNNMDLSFDLEPIRNELQSNGDALFINPKYEHQGYATEILMYGFEYLTRKGYDYVSVASTLASQGFYKRNGIKCNSDGTPQNFENLKERIKEYKEYLKNKRIVNSIDEHIR